MPNPIVEINSTSLGAWTATTGGVNVVGGETVSVRLANSAGVGVWQLDVYGTSDDVTSPTITQASNPTATASFVMPATPLNGASVLIRSRVGVQALGRDGNNREQSSYTTTFGVYRLTSGGFRLLATNETSEGSATYGWVKTINDSLRRSADVADLTDLNSVISWRSSFLTPTITQADITGVGATASELIIKGQDAPDGTGAQVTIQSGAGSVGNGPVVVNSDWTVFRSQDAATWWGFLNSTGLNLVEVNSILFSMQGSAPLIQQQPRTDNAACSDMSFVSQAPYSGASGTNRDSGGFSWAIPDCASGGATGTYTMYVAGDPVLQMGHDSFGFCGATPEAPQTLTGDCYDSSTVKSLISALDNHGIVVDNTTSVSETNGIAFTADQTKTRSVYSGTYPAGDILAHFKFVFFQSEVSGSCATTEYISSARRESSVWTASSGTALGSFLWTVGGGDPVEILCSGGGPPTVSYTGYSCAATTVRWHMNAIVESLPLEYSADP